MVKPFWWYACSHLARINIYLWHSALPPRRILVTLRIDMRRYIRRLTATFFIILANISLLAYAVIPHHHHAKGEVAIVDVVDFYSHGHHEHDHHDSHGEDGCHCSCSHSEECLLNEKPMMVFRGKESELCFQNSNADNATLLLLDALPGAPELPQPPAISLVFHTPQTPCLPSVAIGSNGLRAPPHC